MEDVHTVPVPQSLLVKLNVAKPFLPVSDKFFHSFVVPELRLAVRPARGEQQC